MISNNNIKIKPYTHKSMGEFKARSGILKANLTLHKHKLQTVVEKNELHHTIKRNIKKEKRVEKVGNFFFPRARDGGSWLPGQRSEPDDPDAGTARQSDIRDRGRSLSDSRPDDPSRCSALGG